MAHTCEACGEEFATLSSLRLHDCPEEEDESDWEQEVAEHRHRIRKLERAENTAAKRAASPALTAAIERAEEGDHTAVYQLLAQYERHLTAEWNTHEDDHYDGFHRVFYEPAVDALDSAVVAHDWSFLLDVLDAYWPSVTLDIESYVEDDESDHRESDDYEAFAHVSHVLTTVTGKQMIRTRRRDGVDAIPTRALEYQLLFHRHPGDSGAWIRSMSYGWGIGHADHPVGESIHALVEGGYDIWAGSAIAHAFHADQQAAAELLESIFAAGVVSGSEELLYGLSTIARGRYPDRKGAWDWETIYPEFGEHGFEWDEDVRQRLRDLVERVDAFEDRPDDWTFADCEL